MIAAFGNSFWQDELHNYTVAHVIFIFVLTADIILSPLKSYYDEGILIIDIRSIFFKYTTL